MSAVVENAKELLKGRGTPMGDYHIETNAAQVIDGLLAEIERLENRCDELNARRCL